MRAILIIICISLIICKNSYKATAQAFTPIKQNVKFQVKSNDKLTIGDKVPNFFIRNITNYRRRSSEFSQLKGKITILDFWWSACGACLSAMPDMQLLQNQFDGKLQIILVNSKSKLVNDNEQKINSIISRIGEQSGKKITMPVIYNSTELDEYFPYSSLPHEVWLNDKGIVIAITGAEEVNKENIQLLLDGKKINPPIKEDYSIDLIDHTINELIYGKKPLANKPLVQSILLQGTIAGLKGLGTRRTDDGKVYGIYIANQPLLSLYRSAYRNLITCPDNQIVFENSDSTLFQKVAISDPSYYNQFYSYDLSSKPGTMDALLSFMQADLEKYFHTEIFKEKRKLHCYVIYAPADLNSIHTTGGKQSYQSNYLQNYPVHDVLFEINRRSIVPIIDATGFSKNMDIALPRGSIPPAVVRELLVKKGFKVEVEDREMEVVVIRNRN